MDYTKDFLALVDRLNGSEVVYKKMYELREQPVKLQKFINGLSDEFIDRVKLYIPEKYPKGWYEQFGENIDIFSYNTDIVLWKHNCYTPKFTHSHMYFEIIYVYRGFCRNEMGNLTQNLQEGDICFITPEQEHAIEVNSDSIIINIMVKKSTFLNTFFGVMNGTDVLSQFFFHSLMDEENNRYLLFHTGTDILLKEQIACMFMEYYYHRIYFSNILNGMLIEFFYRILRNHALDIEYKENQDKKIVEILNYIQQHFFDATLESVAGHFHYSASYLSKLLKRDTGNNFVELLRNCRMEHACQLLIGTHYTIGEVSSIIGYENIEHFSRTFKKNFQMSPGEYRKKYQE